MSSLKFIALSGTTGVTENLYVYEYEGDMIVVDCGVGFPESEMYGVDLVIPDFTYIKQNIKKLKGILITHGHEDHLGALPFLLKDIEAPIYSTKLVAGFIEDKFADYKMKGPGVKVFDPTKDVISLGAFKITPFRVSHSVPDAVGFCIDTPEGKIFHVADYKFDWTPVDGRPFDVAKVATLASGGVLALASDCLGATNPGYTESERSIEGRIEEILRRGRTGQPITGQVFFTTISSNISRMQQAIHIAQKLGRKVAFIGRSIEKKAEIAKSLGYLFYPGDLVISSKQASKLAKDKIMYIISGSYGQPGSSLYRLSLGEHDLLHISKGDVVIFSSDPAPPGSKANVDFVVDKLIEADVDVHYYDMQEDLHVSGHGSQKDIEMLLALIKPKYSIPIGGTIRHMRAYELLAQEMGQKEENVLDLLPGDIVEFQNQNARSTGRVGVKEVLVDGAGIGDVGKVVLRDRQKLATDGVAIIIIQLDKNAGEVISTPEVVSRGFVFEGKSKKLLENASAELGRVFKKRKGINARVAKDTASEIMERYFYKITGRRPMVLPVVIEV
ncbi:ribonuclease J [Patescibacteria group bacterium]